MTAPALRAHGPLTTRDGAADVGRTPQDLVRLERRMLAGDRDPDPGPVDR